MKFQDYSSQVNYDTNQHYMLETYKIAQRVSAAAMNTSVDNLITIDTTKGAKRGSRKMYQKGLRSQVPVQIDNDKPFISKTHPDYIEHPAPPPPPAGNRTDDEIRDLPGLTFVPPFAHYSGYLNASQGNYLHYW